MNREPPNIALIAAIIGAAAIIIAAIISLGVPFVENWAARAFPPPTVNSIPSSPQVIIVTATAPLQPFNQPTSEIIPQATFVPSPQNDCSKMIEGEHHFPILGVEWKFESINENRIIHIWSNHWENNLPEYKFFLPAGQSISFMSGGGSFWTEKPGCNGVAQVIYERDTFREISIEDFQRYIQQKTIP